MLVSVLIMVVAFAVAYFLLRVTRFLSSRSGLTPGMEAPKSGRHQNGGRNDGSRKSMHSKNALLPGLVRQTATVKKAAVRARPAHNAGGIRKPWGW